MKIGKTVLGIGGSLVGTGTLLAGISAGTVGSGLVGAFGWESAAAWLTNTATPFITAHMGFLTGIGGPIAGALTAVGGPIVATALIVAAFIAIPKIFRFIGSKIDEKIEAGKAVPGQGLSQQQELAGPAQGQYQQQGKHVPMHQRGEQVDYTKYEGHPANNTPPGFHQQRYQEQGGRAPVQPGALSG